MPRNSSGIYTPPAGTAAVPNATISSTAANNLTADLGNELTNSLPTTGVKGMSANLPMNNNKIVSLLNPTSAQDAATKAYVDAATAPLSPTSVFIGGTSTGAANAQVLATTTPNTFTLTVGNRVVFPPGFTNTGAMTLAVNGLAATNVFAPSASGPVALVGGEVRASQITEAIYDGTQFVLVPNPNAAFGTLTNLASAATTDLGTIPSHNVNITGTTPITSFGSSASTAFPIYQITFAGALTLTYNATSMILPGAVSIPVQAGDTAIALYLGAGNWQIISYQPTASGPYFFYKPAWGGFKNLKVQVASDTTVTVTADELILADSTFRTLRLRTVNVTDTITTSGANGLDTGTATASNWYSVWVIYNASTSTAAALVSLSATAPTLPAGYTFMMRAGWVRYDSQPKLWRTIQYGRRAQIVVGTNPATLPIMASGTQGSPDTPTYVAIATASFLPPTSAVGWFGTSKGANQRIVLAPNPNYGAWTSSTNPPYVSQDSTTEHNDTRAASVSMILESSNVYWASTGSSILAIQGWEENL